MSLSLPPHDSSSPQTDAGDESSSSIQQARQLRAVGTTTVEAVAFWSAVALPVPTILLLALGVGTPTELIAVAGLLIANLMAFYIGHDYSHSPE